MKQTKQFLRPLLMAIVMLVGMLMPKGAWAQSPVTVGDEGFSTIQDAIGYIVDGEEENATLTLHQDLTLEDYKSIDITFYNDSKVFNITIDLNGHTITGGCNTYTNAIEFHNYRSGIPTVTIDNSSQDKIGKLFNCCLEIYGDTKVIVNEGVSLYSNFEFLGFLPWVSFIYPEGSLVNNGDIYGGVGNNNGGSFINNGSVAFVDGEFENNGDYCAYFNWADDGSSFSVFAYDGSYWYYDEWDGSTSITSEVTKEPTCTEPGVRTFTGTFFFGDQEFTDTKEVEIPATGHSYTNKTLTASPIEDGLYAYACDNGCGTHTDDHIIKDFNGVGNHLELTKDGEGNYSTSENVTLADANGFASPIDFTAASVTYNRNIVMDDGMYSFIVPFDIPAAQAAELGTFYQYSKHEEGNVYFDNADGIVRANTAYFFKPAKDITSITVENPTFGTTGTMPDATNPSEPGLYGTYSQIDIPVGAYGYGNMGFFIKAGTDNKIKPFRAYLWLGSGASMANARAFFGDYDVDAIEFIGADDLDLNAPIYNLQGQRIVTPKKGEIYIQNGKKVIKK